MAAENSPSTSDSCENISTFIEIVIQTEPSCQIAST
jgi:hypothetical protein